MDIFRTCSVCVLLLSVNAAIAQDDSDPEELYPSSSTALFLEFGGYAGFYSLNADHIVFRRGLNRVAARAGYAYLEGSTIPIGLSFLHGEERSVEVGVGYVNFFSANEGERPTSDYFCVKLAYRYQAPDGGLFAAVGPQYTTNKNPGALGTRTKALTFSFAIGYTFRPRY